MASKTLTEAWLEGIRAREADQSRIGNPYDKSKSEWNKSLWVSWAKGWDFANIIYGAVKVPTRSVV